MSFEKLPTKTDFGDEVEGALLEAIKNDNARVPDQSEKYDNDGNPVSLDQFIN